VLNQYSIRDLPPEPVDFELVDDDFKADVETAVSMWDNCSIDVGDDPHVEVAVRNDEHQYAGRFDLLTEGNTLCDLKISAAVRDSYRCQIAAYWRALETMGDYPDPESAAIIRLHPDTGRNPELTASVERITAEQVDYWFDEFRRIQQIYRGEH
jgi:hypothetical protein